MNKWYTYKTPFSGDVEMVLTFLEDNVVLSGVGSAIPEYLEWLAAGNIPEPWNPEETA